jgi:putative transposase
MTDDYGVPGSRKRGPWKNLDDREYATLEWVDWFNHRRLLEPIGYIPPAELEEVFHRGEVSVEEVGLNQTGLY